MTSVMGTKLPGLGSILLGFNELRFPAPCKYTEDRDVPFVSYKKIYQIYFEVFLVLLWLDILLAMESSNELAGNINHTYVV